MEQEKLNIRIVHKSVVVVDGYVYNIGGMDLILHEDHFKKGTYTCSEYLTGRTLVKQLPDMQTALNEVTDKISKVNKEKVQKKMVDIAEEEGYINPPKG